MPGPLLHAPSDCLRMALIDLDIGEYPPTLPWPIHIGREPESPDNLVTIYDIRGRDHGRTSPDYERQEHEGIQVRVRSVRYRPGFRKANQIANALDRSILNEVVSPAADSLYLIHSVTRLTNVIFAGTVSKDDLRLLFVINALISVRGEGGEYQFAEFDDDDLEETLTAKFMLDEGSGTTING